MHDEDNYRYIGNHGVVELKVHENILLGLLIKNKHKITTFEEIADTIYGYKVDKHLKININLKISRLRKKLKREFKIFSKFNMGYYI